MIEYEGGALVFWNLINGCSYISGNFVFNLFGYFKIFLQTTLMEQ